MSYASNFDQLTVIDLRAIAADLKIAGRSKMKRAELVAVITRAEMDAKWSAVADEEAAAQVDVEAGELLDAVLGEYVEPTADTGQIAITKYARHEAFATAALGDGSTVGAHITRGRGGRWALMYGSGHVIRAKTLGKVGKLWAKALKFRATTIYVETMS